MQNDCLMREEGGRDEEGGFGGTRREGGCVERGKDVKEYLTFCARAPGSTKLSRATSFANLERKAVLSL